VAADIDLGIPPALGLFDELIAAGQAGSFEFALIDADAIHYRDCYERALTLVWTGALIVVDNPYGADK
jgi:predicted O-methyltransferase YrrM